MTIEERVIRVIHQNLERKDVEVTLATRVKADLALDSLSVLMILNALEEEFSVTLDEADFVGIETVGAMIDYVRAQHPEAQGIDGA